MQRTLIIIAIVIVVLGGGVAAYFTFHKGPSVSVAPGPSLPTAGSATSSVTPLQEPSAPPATTPVSARLVKISSGPVVPGVVVTNSKATASSSAEATASFIERQSGNVYSYAVHAGTLTRTSNKTVPGIQSATWLPNASLAFVRYLSGNDFTTINTYGLTADGSGGFFLPQNVADISVSSSSVLALASGVNGSIASVSRADGSGATEVFSTPLTSLRASFAGKNTYLAFTKPSGALGGAAFLVDNKGSFARIAGPLTGLVAKASPSGAWVLVSYTSENALLMTLINAKTMEHIPLPVATIADKCVWAADDSAIYCGVPVDPRVGYTYPDDWYQGAISFSDRIWKIQVAGRYAQFVLDFTKEVDAPLDAVSLAVDPLMSTLVFVNKRDGSLWSYSL